MYTHIQINKVKTKIKFKILCWFTLVSLPPSSIFIYFSAPSAPTILNVTTVGTDAILIQWLGPEKFFRDIEEYIIEIVDTEFNYKKVEKILSYNIEVYQREKIQEVIPMVFKKRYTTNM